MTNWIGETKFSSQQAGNLCCQRYPRPPGKHRKPIANLMANIQTVDQGCRSEDELNDRYDDHEYDPEENTIGKSM